MAHRPRAPLDPVLLSRARAMRHEPAPAEERLWQHLRNRRLGGFKFRRQTPRHAFVVDFLCHECKLVVELDGGSHGERTQEDAARTQILQRDGLQVVRFYNSDVNEHLDVVLEAILRACESRSTPRAPSPEPSPTEYRGRGDQDRKNKRRPLARPPLSFPSTKLVQTLRRVTPSSPRPSPCSCSSPGRPARSARLPGSGCRGCRRSGASSRRWASPAGSAG